VSRQNCGAIIHIDENKQQVNNCSPAAMSGQNISMKMKISSAEERSNNHYSPGYAPLPTSLSLRDKEVKKNTIKSPLYRLR